MFISIILFTLFVCQCMLLWAVYARTSVGCVRRRLSWPFPLYKVYTQLIPNSCVERILCTMEMANPDVTSDTCLHVIFSSLNLTEGCRGKPCFNGGTCSNLEKPLEFYCACINRWDGAVCTLGTSHPRVSWWRHQMETCSALLALCAGNSPVTGEFPSQRPVTRGFDAFFDLRLTKRLSKIRNAGDLRHHRAHYDVTVMHHIYIYISQIFIWGVGIRISLINGEVDWNIADRQQLYG